MRNYLAALAAALSLSLSLLVPGAAPAKIKVDETFAFLAGGHARIIVFRPDVKVGSRGAGGVEEPNADWTATAREKLTREVAANQKAKGNEAVFLPEQNGNKAQLVADYQALFRVVAGAVVQHKMGSGGSLPTKKDKFDWTLGPEAARLGALGGGDYALFFSTRDAYATTGRKVMQLFALLALGAYVQGGIHQSYAGLVDLKTGRIVWFNMDPGSGGDVRTDEGAAKRVAQLLNKFPAQVPVAPTAAAAAAAK